MCRLRVSGQPVRHGSAGKMLLALPLLVLGACSFTPERAVLEEVRRFGEAWVQTPVDWATVQVLQTVPLDGRTIALAGLTRVEQDGQRSECLFVYEAVRTRLGWRAGGGGGGCGPGAQVGLPMWIGSGQNSSVQAGAWSRVDGLVYADEVVRVEVVWEDGLVQEVEVARGSLLAVREGTHRYEQVRGLNGRGEVVCVQEQPQVTSEKQER